MSDAIETTTHPSRVVPLWCPWCGKRHADEGEFAKRPHHTHLCVTDVYGLGCERSWRLDEVVFGADDFKSDGSNEPHIAVLSEIFSLYRSDFNVEAQLAFGAAIRALRSDDELVRVAEEIEERRASLVGKQKNTDTYTRAVSELESLQRQVRYVVRSMLKVEQCLRP